MRVRLNQERAALAELFRQCPLPVAVIRGNDLVFEMANEAYQHVIGHRDPVHKPLLEVLPEVRGQGYDEALRRVMKTGIPEIGQEALVKLRRRPEGEMEDTYWTFIYAPLYSENGEIDRVTVICNDVTEQVKARTHLETLACKLQQELHERKRIEERLEQTVEERTAKLRETIDELEAFSYSIAHDMRAPLRAMQSFAQLMANDLGDNLTPASKDYLRRIKTSANRMDQLIRDVLTYSSVARTEIKLVPVKLDQLVTDIIESYPQLKDPNVNIERKGQLGAVIGNEAALTQCFSNLLGNAAKFVEAGKKANITIWTEKRGERRRVWIEDNGIGIPVDQHERIFGIFQRLDKNYQGTGIGLAIVKKAIERMSGTVGVQSAPGQGSRFWFDLNDAKTE
jgi:signal transduction histidine kinase